MNDQRTVRPQVMALHYLLLSLVAAHPDKQLLLESFDAHMVAMPDLLVQSSLTATEITAILDITKQFRALIDVYPSAASSAH